VSSPTQNLWHRERIKINRDSHQYEKWNGAGVLM
jgi:ribonucleotide reductase beta subunit family protein with ferritin-like domain